MAPYPSYMSREQLSELLKSGSSSKLAIIDVRDDDYVGGHIRGSKNVPSSSLDYRLPELIRTLKDKEAVVFHCALSQQRGPKAARMYAEEREQRSNKESAGEAAASSAAQEAKPFPQQQVYILDGGFNKWQEKYGEDETLTEGYAPDIWGFGQ